MSKRDSEDSVIGLCHTGSVSIMTLRLGAMSHGYNQMANTMSLQKIVIEVPEAASVALASG